MYHRINSFRGKRKGVGNKKKVFCLNCKCLGVSLLLGGEEPGDPRGKSGAIL